MGELQPLNSGMPALLTKSLSQPELDKHREQIGFLCELTYKKLDKFGWDQMAPALRTSIRKDWMDALAPYPIVEINAARQEFTLEFPRKIPNEGDLRKIIIANRAKKAPPRPSPPRPRREEFDSDAYVAKFQRMPS